jgi:hypothetical protein
MPTKLKQAITRIQKLRSAKGGWAIEATGALSLLVLLVGFSMYNETRGNDRKTAQIAATHHTTVANAAAAYIKDHYSELLSGVPNVGNTTTVSFATLKAKGYVQPTLSSTNIWGQTLAVKVRRTSTDSKAVQLEGLVIGEGGQSVTHGLAREVSQNIGAEGGYTVAAGDYCGARKVNNATLCGTRGVWERPMSDFGNAVPTGQVASALFFKDGMTVNDYLYRHRVPGKPELNTMETYLQMGTGATAVEEQPCYSVAGDTTNPLLDNGAIATTDSGLILSCQSGVWKSQSMKLLGKDVQQGEVTNLMTYRSTNEDGLDQYCRRYDQIIRSNSLLVLNGTTNATSQVPNYSELVVSFYLQGHQIAMNYQVATSTGGFTTSVSASEAVRAGQIQAEICVQSRSVTDWTTRFSISILE